jgi:hypothetical protein
MQVQTFAILHGNGAPEEIRTPDPQIRSLVLYPAELRARFSQSIQGLRARSHSGTGPEGREERFSYPLRPRLARSATRYHPIDLSSLCDGKSAETAARTPSR